MTFSRDEFGSAREQFDEHENDPRAAGPVAPITDFELAVDEAERAFRLAEWGIAYVCDAVALLEAELGIRAEDPDVTVDQRAEFKACWARQEIGRIERDAGFPHQLGMALVAVHGALDAFVEAAVPSIREADVALTFLSTVESRAATEPDQTAGARALEAADRLLRSDEFRTAMSRLENLIKKKIGSLGKKGAGANRYVNLLESIGLGEPADRPLPIEMNEALEEAGALRDVIVHRSSRIDARALEKAPTLETRYAVGDFVRITRNDYRLYSAALRSFAYEVITRARLRGGLPIDFDIEDWRDTRSVNI